MSTFVSAGNQSNAVIRVGGPSSTLVSSSSGSSSNVGKNALLHEVDSELKKLRTQLDSVAKGDSGIVRASNPEETRNYGLNQQVTTSSSSFGMNRTGVNSSFTSGVNDSSGSRFSQSFEVKRGVDFNQIERSKPSTGLNQTQQSGQPSLSSQSSSLNSSLYEQRNRIDSGYNSSGQRTTTPVAPSRVIDSSFSVKRLGDNIVRPSEESSRQESARQSLVRDSSISATVNRVEPTRFEVKRTEPTSSNISGSSSLSYSSNNTSNVSSNLSSAVTSHLVTPPTSSIKPTSASPSLQYTSGRYPTTTYGAGISSQLPLTASPAPASNGYGSSYSSQTTYPTSTAYGTGSYGIGGTINDTYSSSRNNLYNHPTKPEIESIPAKPTIPITSPLNEFAKLRMKDDSSSPLVPSSMTNSGIHTPVYEQIRRSQMLEKQKEKERLAQKPATAGGINQFVNVNLSRSRHREVPADAVPITGNYEPTKLPEPNRSESRKELIKLDLENVSHSSRGQRSGRDRSPSTEKYESFSQSPERRQHDEEIRRNEAKKYAEQNQKITMLTKNIDTVNRENAGLKHEITKLTNQLKKIDELKNEVEHLRSLLNEKDEVIREVTKGKEDSEARLSRLDEELSESRRANLMQMMPVTNGEGFDVAIKHQLEENLRIKERIAERDAEIDRLREQLMSLRMESDEYKREVDIQKVKYMAELNNLQTSNEIELQRLTGENESLQKVVGSLDEKLKFLLKEDKKKDEFLVNYLKGKANNPEDKDLVVNFFKQFEEVPKLSISELMKQEKQVHEELKEQIKRLEHQIEIEQLAQRELRQRYGNIKIY